MKVFTFIFLGFLVSFCSTKTKCMEKTRAANCVCTMNYDPVCGCNNKTYSNDCEAECNGIKTYTKGECK